MKKYNYVGIQLNKVNIITIEDFKKTYVYNNLINNQVYFGNPRYFNDDTEFRFDDNWIDWIDCYVSNSEEKGKVLAEYSRSNNLEKSITNNCSDYKKALELLEKLKKIFENGLLNVMDKFGVYCMAPSFDLKYFWEWDKGGYGNMYNGICVEYETDEIQKDGGDIKVISAGNVVYSDDYIFYGIEYIDVPQEIKKIISPELRRRAGTKLLEKNDLMIRYIFTKPTKWSPENEFRLVKHVNDEKERFVSAKPIKIYIGYLVSDEIKEFIISEICKGIPYQIITNQDVK